MKRIVFPALLLAALAGSAQKVSNNLRFQKGQTFEVTVNMNNTAETMMGESTGNSVTTNVYVVKETSGTTSTLEKSTKKMRASFSVMGQEKTVDSDNPDDLKGMLGEPVKEILATKTEFTVDASGTITAVKATEKKNTTDNPMAAMLMQQLTHGSADLKPGRPSFFRFLPNRDVSKSDTWSDSASSEGITSVTNYTVKDITDSEIILDYTGSGKVDTKQSMMGTSVEAKGTVQSSGVVTLDKASGILKQKTETTVAETTANFGGQEINVKAKTTSVTTVKSSVPGI